MESDKNMRLKCSDVIYLRDRTQ